MPQRHEILAGENESTPVRALNRVALVIVVAFLVVGGISYGLYAAFGGA
jgi:hypothetical protein